MSELTLGPIETIAYPQGSDEWMAERMKPLTCCASEAAAALGVSPHMTRDELVAKMAMGHEKEFSDYVRKRILDRGHESERAAREHLEAELGEELSPLTLARTVNGMRWLASLDGQTMDERKTMEHKDWNKELVAALQRGEVPIDKACQMEHQLVVSGSDEVHFVCSDGTVENRVVHVYRCNPGLRARVVAAWEQLLKDVAAYTPAPAAPVTPVAKTIEALPALSFTVKGELVGSNLAQYKPKALAYIAAINTSLTVDQHFIDAKEDAKFCRDSAKKLDFAIEQALGQMGDINTAISTVRELADAFNKKGLALEKLVESQEKAIKEAEITRGRNEAAKHIIDLNEQLGRPFMPTIPHDFPQAVKGVRSMDSLRNRINTHLADFKILANQKFGVINRNLTWLRENAKDYGELFPDTAQIVLKEHDDLKALAENRIATHKAAKTREEEATRERIRAEEIARMHREAEQAARDARFAMEAEAARAALPPAAAPIVSPASVSQAVAANSPNVVPMASRAAPASPPTLKLGEINTRLGAMSVTAAQLESLGFTPAAREKGAVLFHESDYRRMLSTMQAHLLMLEEQYARQAA